MASPLNPVSIGAPGSLGLNTKFAGLEIGPDFCVSARNCIVSDAGTLASRKGWSTFIGVSPLAGDPDVEAIHEYIDNNKTSRIIWAGGGEIKEGTNTIVDIAPSLTPADNHWKFQDFNGKVVGVQAGENPIVKVDGGDFSEISFDTAPNSPKEVLAAWGRVWYVEGQGQNIKYSDLLQESVLTSGSSGQINMFTVWSNGADEIIGLQEFNNYLVIFGRKQIVLYSGAEDPNSSLQLADIIDNTGCIARDSIQNVGNDIIFLGEEGIISLARNIQAGGSVRSLPLANLSDNAASFLTKFSLTEVPKKIKSCYKSDDGFYLISFPTSKVTFYLNLKYKTEDGRARVFPWYGINPTALHVDRFDRMYVGKPGYLGLYGEYKDNGSPYNFSFKTGWVSGQGSSSLSRKIPKQAIVTVAGGYGSSLQLSWSYDFLTTTYDAETNEIAIELAPAEYGVGEYGIAEYSRLNVVDQVSYRMSGSGKSLQIGAESEIQGSELNIQKIDLYFKGGSIARRGKK